MLFCVIFRVVSKRYSFSGLPFFIWWGAHFEEMRAPGMKFGISLEGIFYSLLRENLVNCDDATIYHNDKNPGIS